MEQQRAADRNNMKGFYNELKEVWGPKKKRPVHLKRTDGMETFSDRTRVVARWSEHFQKLLNVNGDINHEVLLDNIPQRITKTSLYEIPTMDEMTRAIASLKDGEATGEDGIPAEVWKHGGDNQFSRLRQLITNAWEVGSLPQAWKDVSTVTIYKKGDRTDCGNYREISLLTITYLCQDPPQQTAYSHNTRGSSKDTMWLQRLRKHRGYDNCVSDSYKKNALSRTDHCAWYLSTSVRRSIQLGGPGYDSY